jgi:hypothetical protein
MKAGLLIIGYLPKKDTPVIDPSSSLFLPTTPSPRLGLTRGADHG